MKTITRLASVLIAVATIFSFAAVAAEKPENTPPEGPVNDIMTIILAINDTVSKISEMLNGFSSSLQADIDALQMTVDDNFSDIQGDLDEFRADVGANFTEIQEKLDSLSPGQSGPIKYHTTTIFLSTDQLTISCRSLDEEPGEVTYNRYELEQDSNHELYWFNAWNATYSIDYEDTTYIALNGDGDMRLEIEASSDRIFCSACVSSGGVVEYCYLPNDFYVEYL